MLIKIQIAKKQESEAKPKTKTSKTILSYLKSLLNVKVVNPLPRPRKSPSISISGSAFARGNGKHLRRQNVLGQNEKRFYTQLQWKEFCIFSVEAIFYAAANMPNESYPNPQPPYFFTPSRVP